MGFRVTPSVPMDSGRSFLHGVRTNDPSASFFHSVIHGP